ncbi:MAG: hypothetical protein E7175_04960 [Erysipelotrichaceae bacterium]|nr:hypothetical protein [Erysipelotrichaceae bacterium]
MIRKKLFLGLIVPTLLFSMVGCGGSNGSGDGSGEDISTDSRAADDYEKWIDGWSQEGHVYMHYLRPKAKSTSEYDNWGIWIWPNSPQDLEGSLWGAVNKASDATVPHPMTRERMKNIGGSGKDYDEHGVIYDIDLTRDDIIGGKSGNPVSFEGATKVGFLVADLTSMDGTKHWTSDGGANLYIEDFQSHWRSSSKAMHLFITQGDAANFTYTSGGDVEINPTIDDKTGQYVSKESRITDKYANKVSPTSTDFAKLGIGYQIFVASYRDSDGNGMGDIRGIIDSLDYLKGLNVQCIWLTPVFKCESYHGYDTVDYYSIDDKFGTDEDFAELLTEAHKKGIKIILDLVLNHTSKNHTWYRNSQKAAVSKDEALGKDVTWRNIYHWKFKGEKVDFYKNGSYTQVTVENHPDWYKDGESDYYYYGKFGSGMPELNYDNQETRDLVIALGKYWLKKGVDGYRLDAVKHIYMRDEVKSAGNDVIIPDVGQRTYYDEELKKKVTTNFDYSSDMTRNVEFWKEFAFGLKNEYKQCFLVGENFDGYGARIAPYYQAIDSQFDFSNFYHTNELIYKGTPAFHINDYGAFQYTETNKWFVGSGTSTVSGISNYPQGKRPSFINGAYTSNHDTPRAINHVNGDLAKVDSTNAAQVGKAKVHAALTLLNGGLSWIYYGDELGMSGNTDQHVKKYGSENNEDLWYRQPFKWGDSKVVTGYKFNGYVVEWDANNKANVKDQTTQANTANSMYNFYKKLAAEKATWGAIQLLSSGDSGNNKVAYMELGTGTTVKKRVYVNISGDTVNFSQASGKANYINADGSTGGTAGTLKPYSVVVVG